MARGIVVTADKELWWAECATLEDYQEIVGGYIERVALRRGESIWLNEEGKQHGLRFNSIATDLALAHGAIVPTDCIVGDVFIEGPDDGKGNGTDLPRGQLPAKFLLIVSEAGGTWRSA